MLLLSPQKHSYNYYDGSNPAHVPDTKSSSLRKKKFSEPKDSEAAAAEEQPKKKPSFSRYPGKQVRGGHSLPEIEIGGNFKLHCSLQRKQRRYSSSDIADLRGKRKVGREAIN